MSSLLRGRELALLALTLPAIAFGWGFNGHRKLASMMQDPLPANLCLRTWLADHQTPALQDSACDPDRLRCPGASNCDPLEWPRHFLDIDYANPPSSYPRDYAQVIQTMGMVYAQANGQVPWRVEDQYHLLVTAFASKNESQILDTVFFFSHYVTDAFSLLHDTKNFDPNGLHSRWESELFASSSNLNGIAALASSTYFGIPGKADPKNNIFDIVLVGNAHVAELYAADEATSFDAGSGHDPGAFYLASKDLTARRWGDAATMLASLVWTAWAEAGSPVLSGFPASCSMAVPTTEIVLRGFPVPGGFTHDDGGVLPQPDAGVPDAGGTGGGGAGGGGAGGGSPGVGGGVAGGSGGGGEAPASSCDCGVPGSTFLGAIALWLARARRR